MYFLLKYVLGKGLSPLGKAKIRSWVNLGLKETLYFSFFRLKSILFEFLRKVVSMVDTTLLPLWIEL